MSTSSNPIEPSDARPASYRSTTVFKGPVYEIGFDSAYYARHPPTTWRVAPSPTHHPSLSSPRATSTSSNPIESSGVCPASSRPIKVFKGHKWVNSIAYFPDGQHIASASDDNTVIIWDVESGRQVGQPLQHDSSVRWIALSPNGRRIASGTQEGGLVVWNALTQEMVHKIKGDGVWRLAYSPDGRWIASAPLASYEREIRLWDADTGRLGREPLKSDGGVFCVAFSLDGSRIAAGLEDGYFQVIDIATGDSVVGPIKGHTHHLLSVVYSPDGRLLVTASWDKSIRVWDSNTGVEVGKPMLGHKHAVNYISFTTDGRRIVSGGGDETVRVWDMETRLQVGDSFDAAAGWVSGVAFSPDGRLIISGGDHGGVYLWDTESLTVQPGLPSPSTTSAQNAPKVRDHACSETSSILDLPAVQQGSHQAISHFCDTLTKPQISISLIAVPNDWLHANSLQILGVPSIHGKKRVKVDLIYPRLFVYTLEFLECYVPSEVESLKAKYIEWTNNVDETTQLINHGSIMDTLNRYLAQHKTELWLGGPAIVSRVLELDALCIVARILAMLKEPQRRGLLLGQTGSHAQSLLDLIQKLLDSFDLDNARSFLVNILVELSKRSGLYPQRLVLPNIDIRGSQVAGGTFGDVWKGDLDGRAVAVKMMRVFDSRDVQALMKAYSKEAVLWAQLSNSYVLPFCGVYCADEPYPRVCLVSPWMDNGDLPHYLKNNPRANRLHLMLDVALGLEYLHSFFPPVIHGDLKGVNILTTPGLRACLADFGLSVIAQDSNIHFTVTATTNGQGSLPWMAPELFDHINPERRRKSCASDIYAFGCVGYEIFAGRPPFSEFPPMMAIMRNLQLLRPASTELDGAIWELIERCRDANPASRPTASEVVQRLRCHPDACDYELSVWNQKKGTT